MSTSLLPHAHQHAERLDMQLDPTCLGEGRKRGESSSFRHIDRKAGNECCSSSIGLFTVQERGKQLHRYVDEKVGYYILSVAV
jgi:hypothetical protein